MIVDCRPVMSLVEKLVKVRKFQKQISSKKQTQYLLNSALATSSFVF